MVEPELEPELEPRASPRLSPTPAKPAASVVRDMADLGPDALVPLPVLPQVNLTPVRRRDRGFGHASPELQRRRESSTHPSPPSPARREVGRLSPALQGASGAEGSSASGAEGSSATSLQPPRREVGSHSPALQGGGGARGSSAAPPPPPPPQPPRRDVGSHLSPAQREVSRHPLQGVGGVEGSAASLQPPRREIGSHPLQGVGGAGGSSAPPPPQPQQAYSGHMLAPATTTTASVSASTTGSSATISTTPFRQQLRARLQVHGLTVPGPHTIPPQQQQQQQQHHQQQQQQQQPQQQQHNGALAQHVHNVVAHSQRLRSASEFAAEAARREREAQLRQRWQRVPGPATTAQPVYAAAPMLQRRPPAASPHVEQRRVVAVATQSPAMHMLLTSQQGNWHNPASRLAMPMPPQPAPAPAPAPPPSAARSTSTTIRTVQDARAHAARIMASYQQQQQLQYTFPLSQSHRSV